MTINLNKVLLSLTMPVVFGTNAYMSVFGLTSMLASAKVVAVFFALALEFGKFSLFHFLNRFWQQINWASRMLFMSIALLLTLITLTEVFSYLMLHYCKSGKNVAQITGQLAGLDEIESRKREKMARIDKDVSGLGASYVKRRRQERQSEGYHEAEAALEQIATKKAELKQALFQARILAGPLYLAGQFGLAEKTAMSAISVFLAVISEVLFIALTVASAACWRDHPGQKDRPNSKKAEKKAASKNRSNKQYTKKNNSLSEPAETGTGQNETAKFLAICRRFNLGLEDLAKITGLKKTSTVARYLSGEKPPSEKVMRKVRKWTDGRRQKLPDDRPLNGGQNGSGQPKGRSGFDQTVSGTVH